MTQILPGLFRWRSGLTGSHQPVNSYLWRGTEGWVLIDPAADLTPARVGKRGAGSVTDVLVTHVQEEHVAGCVHFPAARVHVPAGDEYLCAGRAVYERPKLIWPPPWEWETKGAYHGNVAGARNERPPADPLALAEPLAAGTVWRDWELVATPGHGKHALTIPNGTICWRCCPGMTPRAHGSRWTGACATVSI